MGVAPPEDAGDDRYAPTAWKSNLVELQLPSGQLCLVRRIPVGELVDAGLVDDFDKLTDFVQAKHVNKKMRSGGPPVRDVDINKQMLAIMRDPEKLRDMIAKADLIVQMVVVKPEILDKPEDEDDRDPAKAYIDWVGDDDKGFIVDFVFEGNADLERFRREKQQLGDGLDEREDLEETAE
jgi:hypothetical protein